MEIINRDTIVKKIVDMPQEQVAKVLIFMAGMEAEYNINERNESKQICSQCKRRALAKEED